jgi:hypothetical protein
LKTRLDANEGGQTITVPGVPAPSPIDTKKNIEFFFPKTMAELRHRQQNQSTINRRAKINSVCNHW